MTEYLRFECALQIETKHENSLKNQMKRLNTSDIGKWNQNEKDKLKIRTERVKNRKKKNKDMSRKKTEKLNKSETEGKKEKKKDAMRRTENVSKSESEIKKRQKCVRRITKQSIS